MSKLTLRRNLMILLPAVALLSACAAELEPVKRVALTQAPGQYQVTLVFPGLHAGQAADLLAKDASMNSERLQCAEPRTVLVSAEEETSPPPKDAPADAGPRSSTKIVGTLACAI